MGRISTCTATAVIFGPLISSSAFFNEITYTQPIVPALYTALTTGDNASNVAVYGGYTNSFVLAKGDVVEIVLNNDDAGKHPFHVHGHVFQTVVRADDDWGHYDSRNHSAFPATPMRRDTLMVRPNSNFVVRFVADNPGVWFFHCVCTSRDLFETSSY